MKTRVILGAVIVIVVMLASVGYYVMVSKPSQVASQEPSADTLVPPIVIATPTPESASTANAVTRLATDDINRAGLGVTAKPYVGDQDTVIFGSLYGGKERGGYEAFDMGYNSLDGTADRLADPSTMLVRLVGRYGSGGFNRGGYNNTQYDQLYNQQLGQLDLQKRKFLVDWMLQNYLSNVGHITLGYPVAYTAFNKGRVTGVIPCGEEMLGNFWTYLNASSLVNSDTLTVTVITAGHGDVTPATFNFFTYTYGTEGLEYMFMYGVYDTLLRNLPNGVIVPSLATSWTIPNSTNVVVQLRADAKWSDGQPVTAQDVAFTFSYMMKTGQPALLQSYLSSVRGVVAVNPTTVQFLLKGSDASFITTTLTRIPIIPQHIFDGLVEKQGVKNPSDLKLTTDMMVGSGPWKLDVYNYGSQIIFERNSYYYTQPHFKYVKFVYFTSDSVAITALEQDQIDMLASSELLTLQQVKELGGYSNVQVVKIPTWTYWFLFFNLRKLPNADRAFRLAVAHMIDYQKIVDVAFGGDLVRGAGFIAPLNTEWADMPLVNRMMATIYSYNLTAAKQILTNGGYQWDSQGRLHYPPGLLSKGLAAAKVDDYNFAVKQGDVISTVPAPQSSPALLFAAIPLADPTRKP